MNDHPEYIFHIFIDWSDDIRQIRKSNTWLSRIDKIIKQARNCQWDIINTLNVQLSCALILKK